MDLDDARIKKQRLRQDLENLIQDFSNETGLVVRGLDLDLFKRYEGTYAYVVNLDISL
jgi:hypothetical protein